MEFEPKGFILHHYKTHFNRAYFSLLESDF